MLDAQVVAAAATPAGRMEMRWVPVTDESGRTYMEACWIRPSATATASVRATAA